VSKPLTAANQRQGLEMVLFIDGGEKCKYGELKASRQGRQAPEAAGGWHTPFCCLVGSGERRDGLSPELEWRWKWRSK
jgi:hypothetical protein